jgi:hypothetical protein
MAARLRKQRLTIFRRDVCVRSRRAGRNGYKYGGCGAALGAANTSVCATDVSGKAFPDFRLMLVRVSRFVLSGWVSSVV